jgi:hypothetical protein
MKERICAVLMTGTFIFGAAVAGWAHHSFAAAYDTTKSITVQGTIVQVRLTNPHSWFFVDVKDANTGQVSRWSFEAGTPSGMIRNGFKATEFKTGTPVTIKAFHARDAGQNAGMVQQIIMTDGKTYGMFGPQENATR